MTSCHYDPLTLKIHVIIVQSLFYPYYRKYLNHGLAHRQLVDYLTKKKKLAKSQSGNRKLHSTETALLCVTDDLLLAMDSTKVSVVVLLDMSKAFDSISHTVLLQKLQALGVSSPSLDWFHSYLTGRCQRVRIHQTLFLTYFR